jgi:hypothetical protein
MSVFGRRVNHIKHSVSFCLQKFKYIFFNFNLAGLLPGSLATPLRAPAITGVLKGTDIVLIDCNCIRNVLKYLKVIGMYRQFNIQQFYFLPTQCIYVFCVDLRTNSDYFPIQH